MGLDRRDADMSHYIFAALLVANVTLAIANLLVAYAAKSWRNALSAAACTGAAWFCVWVLMS